MFLRLITLLLFTETYHPAGGFSVGLDSTGMQGLTLACMAYTSYSWWALALSVRVELSLKL